MMGPVAGAPGWSGRCFPVVVTIPDRLSCWHPSGPVASLQGALVMSRYPRVSLALLALSLAVPLSFAQPKLRPPLPAVEEEPPLRLPTSERYASHLEAARKHIQ